jgi:hypothetical protein
VAVHATDIIEISGVLIPTQWDRRGNIVQVAIQTNTFERYFIETEQDTDMATFIDQSVLAHGSIVGEDVVGQKIIKIVKIETIKNKG